MIAITDLVFDQKDHEPGDDPVRVAAGTEVKESDFDKEVWDHFVANGSVGEAPNSSSALEEKQAEIDRLQAEITRLKEQQAAQGATEPLGDGKTQDVSDPKDPAK